MNKVRTTLRIDEELKKEAEKRALEGNTTLQAVFNDALADYLERQAKSKAQEIVFKTHDLGEPLEELTRSSYYPQPKQ